jgi:hypothetical protein
MKKQNKCCSSLHAIIAYLIATLFLSTVGLTLIWLIKLLIQAIF